MKIKNHFILTFVFCLLAILLPMGVHGETLLDIKSFKVSKNFPAEFLFDLTEGDNFILTFNKVGGNVDVSKIFVQVIDLNDIEESSIGDFKVPGDNVRIPSDGKYLVRFTYTGKAITYKGRKFGNFSLKVESLDTEKQKPGEFRNVTQVTSIAIDDDVDNAFKVIYKVKKGDKISFASADSKAAIVKVNLQQLGRTGFVNSLKDVLIEQDYYLTCNIFIADNNDPVNIYNVRELLKSGDLLFSDLLVTIERKAVSLIASSDVGSSSTGGSSVRNGNKGMTEAEKANKAYGDRMASLQSLQELSMEERRKAMEEQNMSDETMAGLLELMLESSKPKEHVDVFTTEGSEIKISLGPSDNLFRRNKNSDANNRFCQELVLRGTNYNKFFYWVAVGEKAGESFELEMDKFSRYGRGTGLAQAKAEFYYYMSDPENQRRNPPFPNMRNYSSYFSEDVEFAIVDEMNMDKFMKGIDFQQKNMNTRKLVSVEEGVALSPSSNDIVYFACFCNSNKRTPIDVTFKYFTIDTEKSLR